MPLLRRQMNLRNVPTIELYLSLLRVSGRDPDRFQKYFEFATELVHRRNREPYQEDVAKGILRTLASQHNITWTVHPSSRSFLNFNSNSNSNLNSRSNSNTNLNSSSNNNFSSVRKYAERWRFKGPVKLVNLPTNKNNRTDPVSLHTFRTGQEAIRHQRRNTEGRVISTRYYLVPTIERLAGIKWNVIRRLHPNKALVKEAGPGNKFLTSKHVPNVITRLPMYRRNLTLVKFK